MLLRNVDYKRCKTPIGLMLAALLSFSANAEAQTEATELVACAQPNICRYEVFDEWVKLDGVNTVQVNGRCHEAAVKLRSVVERVLRSADSLKVTITGEQGEMLLGRVRVFVPEGSGFLSEGLIHAHLGTPPGEHPCPREKEVGMW